MAVQAEGAGASGKSGRGKSRDRGLRAGPLAVWGLILSPQGWGGWDGNLRESQRSLCGRRERPIAVGLGQKGSGSSGLGCPVPGGAGLPIAGARRLHPTHPVLAQLSPTALSAAPVHTHTVASGLSVLVCARELAGPPGDQGSEGRGPVPTPRVLAPSSFPPESTRAQGQLTSL